MDFWISEWISGFQIGFLDFTVDFWISQWISGFHSGFLDFSLDFWISGFQFGFLPTVYEISFVTDPSAATQYIAKFCVGELRGTMTVDSWKELWRTVSRRRLRWEGC